MDRPELLVAHAYVRYLGDLSGGQQLKRIVTRSLAIGPRLRRIAFYDFGDAAADGGTDTDIPGNGLAQVSADARDRDRIVAEARDAFGRHQQLFEQLAATGLPRTPPVEQVALRDS